MPEPGGGSSSSMDRCVGVHDTQGGGLHLGAPLQCVHTHLVQHAASNSEQQDGSTQRPLACSRPGAHVWAMVQPGGVQCDP